MSGTPIGDMVAQMLANGTDHQTIILAVRSAEQCMWNSGGIPVEFPHGSAIERRRAWDRERKRKAKENSAISTGIPPEIPQIPPENVELKRKVPPHPLKEKTTTKDSGIGERGSGGKQKIQFPSEFHLGHQQLEFAIANGWRRDKASSEFSRFKDYHLSRASKFASWPAAWRTWVRNGIQFAERDAAKNSGRENLYTTALF